MTGGELTATQIRALLQELGRRPQAPAFTAASKLVGGAASSCKESATVPPLTSMPAAPTKHRQRHRHRNGPHISLNFSSCLPTK